MSKNETIQLAISQSTLNRDAMTVDFVVSSGELMFRFDPTRYDYVNTRFFMAGIECPDQVPLLDTHDNSSVKNVVGSMSNFRVENDKLIGTARFANNDAGKHAFTLVADKHLTDCSLGANIKEHGYATSKRPLQVGDQTFTSDDGNDVRIITASELFEVSVCPVGADPGAKVLASKQKNEKASTEPNKEVPMSTEKAPDAVALSHEDIKAAAVKETREIIALCSLHGIDSKEVTTLAQAKDLALASAAAKLAPIAVPTGSQIVLGKEDRESFSEFAQLGIALRLGQEIAPAKMSLAREAAGLSLIGIARETLSKAGKTVSRNDGEVLKLALSTSDFPVLLQNVANKGVKKGWDEKPSQWRKFFSVGTVNDFKTNTRVRASELMAAASVKAEGEGIKYTKRTEEGETFKIQTIALGLEITRELLINDDLGQIQDNYAALGREMRQSEEDIAFDAFLNPGNMGDGNSLFFDRSAAGAWGAASINNIGTSAVFGATSLTEAIVRMGTQKDVGGRRRLNLRPTTLVIPVALEYACRTFLSSAFNFSYGTTSGDKPVNIYQNFFGDRIIVDSRLDAVSATAWYLFAEPAMTFTMFYLNGVQTPFTESAEIFENDTVKFKARLDLGAKAMDWRGVFKNAGA